MSGVCFLLRKSLGCPKGDDICADRDEELASGLRYLEGSLIEVDGSCFTVSVMPSTTFNLLNWWEADQNCFDDSRHSPEVHDFSALVRLPAPKNVND